MNPKEMYVNVSGSYILLYHQEKSTWKKLALFTPEIILLIVCISLVVFFQELR